MDINAYLMMDKAKYVRDVRKSLGLTQMQFAHKLWPDIPETQGQSRLAKYETARVDAPIQVISAVEKMKLEHNR